MIGSVKLFVSLKFCHRLKWDGELGKINKSIKQLNNEGGEEKERDLKEAKETYEQ